MNCIYLDGHTYSPDDLRALIADRDQWQAEAERLRVENARLIESEALNHEAIVLLATENAATATPEAMAALAEAMEEQPDPYDVTLETYRVTEALGIRNGDGTISSALVEAFNAGASGVEMTPFDWNTPSPSE